MRRLKQALEAGEAAFRRAPWWSPIVGTLAALLSISGEQERANQLVTNMRGGSLPMGMMNYHLYLGHYDAAIDWYERAIEQRLPAATSLASARFLKPLRDHPRWPRLAQTMNLPDTSS